MVANGTHHTYVDGIGLERIHLLDKEQDDMSTKDNDFITHHVLNKRIGDIGTKDLTKLKDIARLHVPSHLRVKLWMMLTGGADVITQTTDVYAETCQRLFAEGMEGGEYDDYDDEHEMVTYYLNKHGIKTVHKLLIVVKDLHPDVTYCPLLSPIIAVLLHFMDDNQCYACISAMLDHKHSNTFLEQTKFDNALTDLSLQDLFKSINKKGYARLKSFVMKGGSKEDGDDNEEEYDPSKIVLFPLWRNMIFGKLDFPIVVRIMDCLLVEGAKILYRIGLSLLNMFHSYSFQFQNMQFSDTQDLLATIAQYTQSLDDLGAKTFMKSALKINLTSKQITKIRDVNTKMYKEQLKEYIESDAFTKFTKQVIPVNLNQVSDIIKPVLWLQVCEWLPARMQLKQPVSLFSTNKDGFNLKTLYNLCEDEEQTLILLTTTNGETLGAYLSTALHERTSGRYELSFFGTGETSIFRLSPKPVCYLWNKERALGCQHGHKSKYVFVEPTPLYVEGKSKTKRQKSTNRKSLMRRLSRRLSGNYSKRGVSVPNTRSARELTALERLQSHSHNRHTGNHSPGLGGHPTAPQLIDFNPDLIMDGHSPNGSTKERALSSARHSLPGYEAISASGRTSSGTHEPRTVKFSISSDDVPEEGHDVAADVAEADDVGEDVVKKVSENHEDSEHPDDGDECHDESCVVTEPPMQMFIACDDNNFIIGGGGEGQAQGLYFDGEINKGRSSRCETYRNEPLTFADNGDFLVARLDVFGFH